MKVTTKCAPTQLCCPAVIKTDRGTYIIIGKKLDLGQHDEIKDRVGLDEAAVEIDADLVEAAVSRTLP